MKGRIHSIQSMGTVDGPGVRTVVFTRGCPLRCVYCQNPDTWDATEGELTEAAALAERIIRFYPYIKNGGVTFSGGEPCLEADFICEVASLLKEMGLHIAIDTCGEVQNASVDRLLSLTDLVLLDIKMTSEEDYKKYTGGSLKRVMDFLGKLEALGKDTWIRHVIVPGINDSEDDLARLADLIHGYSCIRKVELLPYRNLCIEKYKALGIPFALENTPPLSASRLSELSDLFERYRRSPQSH